MTAPLLIGIGHSFRGDDAIGPLVAQSLAGRVEAVAHHGEGAALMELWQGRDLVVAVDCMVSGGATGTIRRFEASEAPLPAHLFPKGSHQFGLAEAVEMARLLGRLPRRLVVVGVEGRQFALGSGLSAEISVEEVEKAAAEIIFAV